MVDVCHSCHQIVHRNWSKFEMPITNTELWKYLLIFCCVMFPICIYVDITSYHTFDEKYSILNEETGERTFKWRENFDINGLAVLGTILTPIGIFAFAALYSDSRW